MALPELVTSPVKFALVVTVPAVRFAAVPVRFVATPLIGVPSAGVTSVGLVANTSAPLPVSSEITPARAELIAVPPLSNTSDNVSEVPTCAST